MRFQCRRTFSGFVVFSIATIVPVALRGSQVTVTITGTVADGFDTSGVFGPANTRLTGTFTLVYTFDDTKGTPFLDTCDDGEVFGSGIDSSSASNTGTAIVTINGKSFQLGGGSLGETSITSRAQVVLPYSCAGLSGRSHADYFVQVLNSSNGYAGGSFVSTNDGITPAVGTVLTTDSNWEHSFTNSNLDGIATITLYILITALGPGGYLAYNADASLLPKEITVNGPGPTCSAASPTCATQPRILRDGTTDITGAIHQPAVVGQEIDLTALLPPGAMLAPPPAEPWSVEGTTIGGFLVTQGRISSGHITSPDFTDHSVNSNAHATVFYWYAPGTFQVTLSCILSNGQSARIQATFDVAPPPSVSVNPRVGTVSIDPGIFQDEVEANILHLYNSHDPSCNLCGIVFTPSPETPASGRYVWVQLIDQDKILATNVSGMLRQCKDTTGGQLDSGEYPYRSLLPNTNIASDSPPVVLNALFVEINRMFMARMFLMWDPALPSGCIPGFTCTSIPIPLGLVSWRFSADAVSNLTWIVRSSSASADPFKSSIGLPPALTYPQWNAASTRGTAFCNPSIPQARRHP